MHLLVGAAVLRGGWAAKPMQVSVYYEADCPFCKKFIAEEVRPLVSVANACMEPLVDFNYVPYGIAKVVDGQIQCRHGEDECWGNRLQLCAKAQYSATPETYSNFVVCMMTNMYQTDEALSHNKASYANCAPAAELAQLEQCASSPQSLPMLQKAGVETAAAHIQHAPWAVMPDAPTYNLQGSLKDTLCASLPDKNVQVPACCQEQQQAVAAAPAAQQPVAQQPMVQQQQMMPSQQQLLVQQPLQQQPYAVVQQPLSQQPVAQQPVAQQPLFQQPVAVTQRRLLV